MKNKQRVKKIRYCVGVDILGFPVYEYHFIGY
jgi:hypothetical protein